MEKRDIQTTEPRTAGVAHILAQRAFHDPAFIIGDCLGLARIRDAINAALEAGEARRGVFAQDGEGYGVHVLCITEAEMDGVPYGYTDTEMCGDRGPWTDAMIRSVQNGGR